MARTPGPTLRSGAIRRDGLPGPPRGSTLARPGSTPTSGSKTRAPATGRATAAPRRASTGPGTPNNWLRALSGCLKDLIDLAAPGCRMARDQAVNDDVV